MKYKAAIFDFDGTLFDTGEGITECIAKTLSDMGKKPLSPEDLASFVGPSLFESFETKCGITGDEAVEAVRIFREYYQKGGGVFKSRLYEGVEELLSNLKANHIKIAVASSKPQTMVELLLEKYKLMPLFDCINAASGAEETSDKADKVKATVGAMSLFPDDCLMVGDRRFDIEAAKAVGMDSAYALYGYGNKDEMEACCPTYCAKEVADLERILLK